MPLDFSDALIIKFLTENFEKSEEKRMRWFLKNEEKLIKSSSFPKNYKGLRSVEVAKVPIELCMPSLAIHHKFNKVNRRRRAWQDGVIQGVSQLNALSRRKDPETLKFTSKPLDPEPVMKSIDPNIQSILYETLPNGGRSQYLDKRKRVLPENKFNFCETSTSVYGWRRWRLNDSGLSHQSSSYGRYFAFTHDINRRSGVHPDPAYYQELPNEPYKKCSR